MKKVTVIENQSIFDLAVQELGSIEDAFAFARKNDLMVTDKLTPGAELSVSKDLKSDKDIARYYDNHGITPGSFGNLLGGDKDLQGWFAGFPGMLPMMLG